MLNSWCSGHQRLLPVLLLLQPGNADVLWLWELLLGLLPSVVPWCSLFQLNAIEIVVDIQYCCSFVQEKILLQLCSRKNNIAAAVFKKKYCCSLNQVDIYSWEGDKDVLGSLLHFGTTSLWSINVWFMSARIADLIQGPNMQSNERTMMMRASYPMSMPLLSGMSINLCLKLAFQLEETIFLGQVETPNNNCCQDLSS